MAHPYRGKTTCLTQKHVTAGMEQEDIGLKQIGISGRSKEEIIELLRKLY